MNREEAINVLIALGVCCTTGLNCEEHCPFYSEDGNRCNKWNDERAKEAVKILRRESGS
ncbi:hypothetical protein [Faecalicatena contorta]|uniref:Uncharacterized protein n=1 Tax=Faecalicatena contorta TaxID=39482 RepID=A0A315ZUR5_9FIRM|nr:hypothetical protein [Faecalicatena contorta]PWJ49331.1 hypothetical protein A8805_10727 [Faecalicatena contorta]SUQ14575.1 hypothetical protein SAMN05216529_10727 [Faecalicatena contorta]